MRRASGVAGSLSYGYPRTRAAKLVHSGPRTTARLFRPLKAVALPTCRSLMWSTGEKRCCWIMTRELARLT